MGLFAFGRIASKENHAFDVSSMALERAGTCAVAKTLNNLGACRGWAKTKVLQSGSILFIGCANTSADDFKMGKGIAALKVARATDGYKRKGGRILRAFTSNSKDLKRKYAPGGVVVARIVKPLAIYAFDHSDCSISRETEEEYDMEDAQCFCKGGLNGFARLENEQLIDIRVCDVDDPSVLQLIGFIPKEALGSEDVDNDVKADILALGTMETFGLHSKEDLIKDAYQRPIFRASRVKRKAPKRKPTKTKRKASNTCYCLRCKRAVVPLAPRMTVTANGRNLMKGTCPNCSGRVASFRA